MILALVITAVACSVLGVLALGLILGHSEVPDQWDNAHRAYEAERQMQEIVITALRHMIDNTRDQSS